MAVIEVAIERIRDLIVSGQLKAGQRLPAEAELASDLGVSRNSMREAVRALSQVGVLNVRHGDGTYVSSLQPEVLLGGLSMFTDLVTPDGLVELFEVRRLLEPAATGLAARTATAQDISELRASLDAMRDAHDLESLVHLDIQFHQRVVACTGNVTLQCLLAAVANQSLRARLQRTVAEKGIRTLTVVQHKAIVDAIAAGDAVLAISASTVHVSSSERWLRDMLGASHPAADVQEVLGSEADVESGSVDVPDVLDLHAMSELLRRLD